MSRTTLPSRCGTSTIAARYRYTLSRRFEGGTGLCVFVMLNPSTADAHSDDPTIARCRGFAQRWGYAGLRVVNLFALRATHPVALYRARNPAHLIGRNNDAVVKRICRQADRVVAAWGNHGHLYGRAEAVLAMLPEVDWHCLGTTKSGHPRHPGRIRSDTPLQPFVRKSPPGS